MSEVVENLTSIRNRIEEAVASRVTGSGPVELIAVSKTFPAPALLEAFEAGQRIFGESKLQEAEPKVAELPRTIEWHFIGRVQRNKVRRILASFPVIHAIDSLRLAAYADGVAAELGVRPRVFLQVNLAGEESKGGFSPAEIFSAMSDLLKLGNLQLAGLMTIPPDSGEAESARPWFRQLRELRDELERTTGASLPALSMGMSNDYEVAIEEGATHVRVGSAIFGKRSYRVAGELG
jgi:PLP dependent protein